MSTSAETVHRFEEALLSLDRLKAREILRAAIDSGNPLQGAEQLVVPAFDAIGKQWEQGAVALSQVYMSGRICEELMGELLPQGSPDRKRQPKMALAVLEDYHMLGKRMVHSMLRVGGFEPLDYGRVTVDEVVGLALRDGVEVLLLSTLMLASARRIKDVQSRLQASGATVKLIVGGAPFRFDDQLWRDVGADAMGRDAGQAVELVNRVMGGAK